MQCKIDSKEQRPSNGIIFQLTRTLSIATAFGLAALAIVEAEFTIPIVGTGVVTDPREIFTVIGASLTGPLGGYHHRHPGRIS